ncbi:MAG: biotin--[acetyl-CoA-carboxylase] ligase [Chthoniobacterales bacterium]
MSDALDALPDPDILREGRGDGPIGKRVIVFREVSSTNDLLLQMGEEGEPEGTVVFAGSQTKGKGSHGRVWDSAPNRGLWFSFLLHPDFHPEISRELTAFAALAVQRALSAYGLAVAIKAPNDIYVSSRKIAGMLTETRIGKSSFAVVGIGINVLQGTENFPEVLRNTATSLLQEGLKEVSLPRVALDILKSLNVFHARFLNNPAQLFEDYTKETGEFRL